MTKSIPVTMSFIPYGITTLQECSFTNYASCVDWGFMMDAVKPYLAKEMDIMFQETFGPFEPKLLF
jgi:hypothetical protein